jgi:recombination protein RecT
MANEKDVKQALDVIPEAKSLIDIVAQAAKEVKLNQTHLMRVAATAIRLNPKLAKCTPASFVGALIALEQVGLEPVAGRAYLLPFLNNRKVILNGKEEWRKQYEVQALIGYKGYSDLFYRHESALSMQAATVHKTDQFDFEYGTNSFLRHKPALGDRGPAIAYYAIAKLKEGGVLFLVMSKEECIEHGKKHSKVYDKRAEKFMPGTPWVDDEDSMCKKTVLLQLTKNLPLSIETQKALSVDETSREYRPGIESALDLPDTTNWEEGQTDTDAAPAKVAAAPAAIPTNVLEAVAKIRVKVGDALYYRILGELGYERIEQISDMPTINKLISGIDKEYAALQR